MKNEYLYNWFQKAENDLKIVKHELALPEEEVVKDIVCFHCQQAIEKYLKVFLIYNQKEFRKTHIIEELLYQCEKIDADFIGIDIRDLSEFAVDVRYADDYYIPTMDEVKFYYKLTRKIRKLVLSKIKM